MSGHDHDRGDGHGHRHEPDEHCLEVFARLSEYVDGELDDLTCAEIESHIDGCMPCEQFIEALRRTIKLVGDTPRARLTDAMKQQICDQFRRR